MRGASLRLLSAVAAASNMRMRRWDFVAAYLEGELVQGEVVYCLPPSGYAKVGRDGQLMVCKVVKRIGYGASRSSMATLALPVAPRIRLHPMQLRPLPRGRECAWLWGADM